MEDTNILKILFLQRLIRGNIWGGKHIPLEFITKSIPEYYRNSYKGQKLIVKSLKELINTEWVIITFKRTGDSSDEHISLNPRKVSEIKQYLEINN